MCEELEFTMVLTTLCHLLEGFFFSQARAHSFRNVNCSKVEMVMIRCSALPPSQHQQSKYSGNDA